MYVLDAGSTPQLTIIDPITGTVSGRLFAHGSRSEELSSASSLALVPSADPDALLLLDATRRVVRQVVVDSASRLIADDVISLTPLLRNSSLAKAVTSVGQSRVLLTGLLSEGRAIIVDGAHQRVQSLRLAGDPTIDTTDLRTAGRALTVAGVVAIDPSDMSRFVIAHTFEARLILVNGSTAIGHTYGADTMPAAQLRVRRADAAMKLFWRSDATQYYTAVAATKDLVAATVCECKIGAPRVSRYLRVFDWQGKLLRSFVSKEPLQSVAFSPDGQSLAAVVGAPKHQGVVIWRVAALLADSVARGHRAIRTTIQNGRSGQ